MPYQPLPLNYYRRLQVSQNAPAAEIKAAYERLMHYYDSKRISETHLAFDLAASRTKEIQAAYEILGDKCGRQMYDSMYSCGSTLSSLWHSYCKYVYQIMDAELGMLAVQALPGEHPYLDTFVLLSLLARNIYKDIDLDNYSEEMIFMSLVGTVSVSLSSIENKSWALSLEDTKNYLSLTPAGKAFQALRYATREDVYHAPQSLFQYAKSTTVEVAKATSNLIITTLPKKWNSLSPSAQSASLFLTLATSYLCITNETDPADHNKTLNIALLLSCVDYGVRKVSKNTYGLFSAVVQGVFVAGEKAKHVIQSCHQNKAEQAVHANSRYNV